MSTTPGYEHRGELVRSMAKENQKIGEARGKASAVLTLLEARGVAVPADARERILACTDMAQLDSWLRRVVTATDIEELLQP